jgi:hypothetical protein
MAKKKTIVDKPKSDQKSVFRIPTAPSTTWHKDKSKYNRKKKHKKVYDEN